jgi:hypothetical protein
MVGRAGTRSQEQQSRWERQRLPGTFSLLGTRTATRRIRQSHGFLGVSDSISVASKVRRIGRVSIDDQIGTKRAVAAFAKAFNDTAGSFLANAMPQFRSQLQLTREDAVRRGVGTGDLGTSTKAI